MDEHTLEIELERAVLKGLSAEWDGIQWRLPASLQNRMRKPAFRLSDMTASWGLWSPDTHEIILSRLLVTRHPWDAIREVFLHEVAHQAADLDRTSDETSHGPTFRRICEHIGANPRASDRYPLLHDRLADGGSSVLDTIRLKIRKLLALSNSTNPHEARTALLKAHQLMARHQLDTEPKEHSDRYLSVFVGRPALRHTRDHWYLASLLGEFYFVETIWVPAWVLEKEKMGSVLEISGTPANVQVAAYVHDYIRRFIDRRWKEYNRRRRLHAHRKTDYAIGIIEGFRAKLAAQKKKEHHAPGDRQLLRTGDRQLALYLKRRHPHVRSMRSRGGRQDPSVLEDGHRAGRRLTVTPAVGANAGTAEQRETPIKRLPSPPGKS